MPTRPQQKQRYNSPTLAYIAVYSHEPEQWLRGRTDSPKKTWRGIRDIDANIKDGWLEDLNSIPEIEIRSSDEGKSAERVAFCVIRFKSPAKDKYAEALSKKLDSLPDIYSLSDIGAENRPRICVAGKVECCDSVWEAWWDSLAGKIRESVSEVLGSSQIASPSNSGGKLLGYVLAGGLALGVGYVVIRGLKKK